MQVDYLIRHLYMVQQCNQQDHQLRKRPHCSYHVAYQTKHHFFSRAQQSGIVQGMACIIQQWLVQ
jgi:hypothetical protein